MGKKLNRRNFLNKIGLGCAQVGAVSFLSGITNMGLLQAAASANRSWVTASPSNGNYKALVCILLSGGNDSYNMLVPKDNESYNDYASVRTNLALGQSELLSINPINTPSGKEFGIHPSMPNVKELFDNEKLSFVANVGALVRPTNLNDYLTFQNLPLGLYSHSDQIKHWQTSVPDNRNALGWGGRLADILQSNNNNQDISMNISFKGQNLFQRGNEVLPFAATTSANGTALISGSSLTSFYQTLKRETVEDIVELSYSNALEQAYASTVSNGISSSVGFDAAISQAQPLSTVFDVTDNLQAQLKMAARIMSARNILDVCNQTFFIQLSGFDTHDNNLVQHSDMLSRLDDALHNFQLALEELGLEEKVTTFTMSDFGRKLTSNGDGSDHGWGGNAIVMGGAVAGKRIIGEYPDLYLGNSLDTGGGRLIPTTSTDEFYAELALWFGASESDLTNILPNLSNFWIPGQGTSPLGFMS